MSGPKDGPSSRDEGGIDNPKRDATKLDQRPESDAREESFDEYANRIAQMAVDSLNRNVGSDQALRDTVPDLEGGPISSDAYEAGVPEKLELIEGLLITGRGTHGDVARERLLRLLLTNVGLLRTLDFAPLEKWEQALTIVRQRYGR
jgi:hypothetical protein